MFLANRGFSPASLQVQTRRERQEVLQTFGLAGHRHHVNVTPGHVVAPLQEVFGRYLRYELTLV